AGGAVGVELPDVADAARGSRGNLEPADYIQPVVDDAHAARQYVAELLGPGVGGNGGHHIGDRVIPADGVGGGACARGVASHHVDVGGAAHGEHAADHVVVLVIGEGGVPDRPGAV